MNYRNMTNADLIREAEYELNCAERDNDRNHIHPEIVRGLAARLVDAEAAQVDVLAELDERFPEIRDDEELSGGDAVARLSEWRCEL